MNISLAKHKAELLVADMGLMKTAPISVETIAQHLRLPIVEENLGNGVSGVLIYDGKTTSIAVQKSDSENRKRFTIAHEVAHYYLGHQFTKKHVHVDGDTSINQRSPLSSAGMDPQEIEANQFAAALLMPSRLVRNEVNEFELPLSEEEVVTLAKRFKVSEQAMTIRLMALGLL